MYTHIIHLADIHIRTDRTDEYLYVFNNLFKTLRSLEGKLLICICGDIIHERSRITAEVINKLLFLLTNLSELGTVILINGNHDIYENNTTRDKILDVLLEYNLMSSLNYITTTSRHTFSNVSVTINAIDDKDFLPHNDTSKLHIALGHYTLKEVFPTSTNKYSVDDHKGYDYVLLGDIHSQSHYKPNCYYSGSLIQQNFGESIVKGIGIIDISKKEYNFKPIDNKYGYITIKGNTVPPSLSFPSLTRLRVTNENIIKKVTPFTEIISVKTIPNTEISLPTLDTSTILNNHPQKEILQKLHTQYGFPTTEKTPHNYSIINIEFENILNYDRKCTLDFQTLNGIIGIQGNNASGKSNILRTIIFQTMR